MPTKIFVGNLSPETQSDDIRVLFEKYGSVAECDVLNRYGFVHMNNEEEAMAAIDGISGLDVHGSKINVELSRSKPRKPGGGKEFGGRDFGGRGRGRGGSRGGRGGGRGRPMDHPGGGPRRPAYDPYPAMDRFDRYDRYDDYYRYDRTRPYPDPYERERRPLPGERPLPPLYDRRPLPGARLTPPSDPYRRPPPEYYDRSGYGSSYETRRELPGQLPREHAIAELAARERDPYYARERDYALADRGDPMRSLAPRDPYAREREATGNGYDYRSEYRRYDSAQSTAYPDYSQRSGYGESSYGANASSYGSSANASNAGYGSSAAAAHETYRDPYASQRGAQDGYGQSTPQPQSGSTKMDQSFLAKGPIFF